MKIKKFFMFAAMAAFVGFGMSCSSDDNNDDGGGTPPDEPDTYDVIVGKWRSPVVAPILADFADSIHAEFKDNQTYVVQSYKDGAPVELTGTYVTSDGLDNIRNIILNQNAPTSLTSEGIYEVDGDMMTYEVAQTEPVQPGVTPPTPEAGFGSTSDGAFLDLNIQVYYKMD